MKILLANPNSEFLINEKVFPSLGLLYLSAYIKKRGYRDVSLLDMNDEKPLPARIDADIVGLYSNTPQFPAAVKLIKRLKKINTAADPVYVLGGPHVSGKPEDGIREADIVVKGEGEMAFYDIVYRKERSQEQEKVMRYEYMTDIDELPFPDRDIIDIKSYRYFLNGKLTATVISSRGCPFGCNFCANNAWGKSLRMRSPFNVFREVEMLKERYGYEAFMFFDDTMTVDKRRMAELCALLKKLNIIYRCFIRSDTVNSAILKKMHDSGCVEVGMGLESGSDRILKTVNKGETVRKNMEAIRLCQKEGIRVKGFLIIGLPGENKKTVQETREFLEEADLDDLDISIFTPYPGSLIYEQRDRFDIQFQDDYAHAWYKGKPGAYRSLVATSRLTADEILQIRNDMESEFKCRPK